ncbi:MAG: prolyl aminopeptidase [Actinomycetia bacterium]|nr:prolyl aminopeptidase [Actinomycetes bacterium]
MPGLYPPLEPHAAGALDVGDGHRMHWEASGNPDGAPAVVLHGGPGSGCTPTARRYFDPDRYRIVLFDQRSCGRSTPHAADAATELSANTTAHLVRDIEQLRRALGVDRWLVFGQSWGSTLAVAYAEHHPERVSAMVLGSVALTRRSEINWLTGGLRTIFPDEWAHFDAGAGTRLPGETLVEAYSRRLEGPDAEAREEAARAWCRWEDAIVKLEPDQPSDPRYDDPRFRMAFARIVTHYWRHHAWFADDELLHGAARLEGTAGVLVHGRRDVGSPLSTAQALAHVWPGAELVVVDGAGHSALDPGMAEHLVGATDRLAGC